MLQVQITISMYHLCNICRYNLLNFCLCLTHAAQENHADIRLERILPLLTKLDSADIEVLAETLPLPLLLDPLSVIAYPPSLYLSFLTLRYWQKPSLCLSFLTHCLSLLTLPPSTSPS
jgi:hypothetical protein